MDRSISEHWASFCEELSLDVQSSLAIWSVDGALLPGPRCLFGARRNDDKELLGCSGNCLTRRHAATANATHEDRQVWSPGHGQKQHKRFLLRTASYSSHH